MDLPLVVGIDGSPDALRAVDWAADEAALRGCPLRLLYASLWAPYEASALSPGSSPRVQRASAAQTVVSTAEGRARSRRPEVVLAADVCNEDPVHGLVDASDRAAAIIVGSRGHGLSGVLLVVESRARPALLQAAAHADLLVVGARRRRDPMALQLGLVNHAMLHYAPCTVAVVPAEGRAG
ncbi:universal stress protein [Streptomyces sp. NBC_00400]|uniref:universal stress protein n=1 Tax=Streptomyces sp. NBC_00400 TaxID=2975737 RepID=UPI002E223FD6